MKIYITNFRSHASSGYDIPERSLTLLSGVSGAGKSTILQSILWCLYGSMTHIYPGGSRKKDQVTTVKLTLDNGVTIERCKPPDRVMYFEPSSHSKVEQRPSSEKGFEPSFSQKDMVEAEPSSPSKDAIEGKEDGLVLYDIEAQQKIFELFGSKNLFLASSYLVQGGRSPLTTLPGADKFRLLHELTFGDISEESRPESYLLRVNGEIKRVGDTVMKETGGYEALLGSFNIDVSKHGEVLSRWKIREVEEDVKEKENLLVELTQSLADSMSKEQQLKICLDGLNAVDVEIEKMKGLVKPIDEGKISELTRKKGELSQEIKEAMELEQNKKELSLLYVHEEHLRSDFDEKREYARLLEESQRWRSFDIRLPLELGAGMLTPKTLEQVNEAVKEKITEGEKINEEHSTWKSEKEKWEKKKAEYDSYRALLFRKEYNRKENQRLKDNYILSKGSRREWVNSKAKFDQAKADLQVLMVEKLGKIVTLQEIYHEVQHSPLTEKCPHCEGSLIRVEGKLAKGDSPEELALRKENLKSILHSMAKVDELSKKISTEVPEPLEPEYLPIPEVAEEVSPPKELEDEPPRKDLSTLLLFLDHIQSLKKPGMSKETMGKLHTSLRNLPKHRALSKYFKETPPIEEITSQLTSVSSLLQGLISEKKTQDQYQWKLTRLQHRRGELSKTLSSVGTFPPSEEIRSRIESLNNSIQDLRRYYSDKAIVSELQSRQAQLNTKRQEILNLSAYSASLLQIKDHINQVATDSLSTVVSDINQTLNSVCNEIFDDDIQLSLQTKKLLKTKDVVKLGVNLQIRHKSNLYDKTSFLSGGEQDRVSLALTIAMSKLNSSPIVLLDECMASLNSKLREKCVNAIRVHLPGKTVLHVCHEIVQGDHDHVINLCC